MRAKHSSEHYRCEDQINVITAINKFLLESTQFNKFHSLQQFMGVHIFNASITIHNDTKKSPWSLLATSAEVHADGAAGGPARALVFSTKLVDANIKVVGQGQCLAEVACSLVVEGTVKADGPLNVEVSSDIIDIIIYHNPLLDIFRGQFIAANFQWEFQFHFLLS